MTVLINGAGFHPFTKGANTTLSNSNKTMTVDATGSGTTRSALTTFLIDNDKSYWEVSLPTLTAGGAFDPHNQIGIVGSQFTGDNGGLVFVYGGGLALLDNGDLVVNTTTVFSGPGFAQGDVVCIAVDGAAKKLWYRVNGGSWTGATGSNDPATGTGGADYSSLSDTAQLSPAVALRLSGDTATINFGATTLAQTPPSGFTPVAQIPARWHALTKASSATLSGGNLTVSVSGADAMTKANHSVGANNIYWEVTDSGFAQYGVASSNFDNSTYVGNSGSGIGGAINYNGTTFDAVQGFGGPDGSGWSSGNVVRFAWNGTLKRLFIGVGSNWYGQPSITDDPVTGTGGLDVDFTVASKPNFPVFPQAYGGSGSATANFGASAFTYSIPSGYVALQTTAGGTTITGSLATTDPADTLVATGTVRVSGSLATTDPADTLVATGTVRITGSLATTDPADTLVATGTVGNTIHGTLATTDPADTLVATGTVRITGSLATTDPADTLVATGTVAGTTITGSLSTLDPPDVLVATGTVLVRGSLVATDDNDILTATGTITGYGLPPTNSKTWTAQATTPETWTKAA